VNSTVRTILFLALNDLAGGLLWRWPRREGSPHNDDEPNYTNFLAKVQTTREGCADLPFADTALSCRASIAKAENSAA